MLVKMRPDDLAYRMSMLNERAKSCLGCDKDIGSLLGFGDSPNAVFADVPQFVPIRITFEIDLACANSFVTM